MAFFTTSNEAQDRAESAPYRVHQVAKVLGMRDPAFDHREATDEDRKWSKALVDSALCLTTSMGRHMPKNGVRKRASSFLYSLLDKNGSTVGRIQCPPREKCIWH